MLGCIVLGQKPRKKTPHDETHGQMPLVGAGARVVAKVAPYKLTHIVRFEAHAGAVESLDKN